MSEYFDFKQEKIHPQRVGVVIERLNAIFTNLDIQESTLLDTSSVDSITALSVTEMSESDVAKTLSGLVDKIENLSSDDEDMKENLLNHTPLRALYNRAVEIQNTN